MVLVTFDDVCKLSPLGNKDLCYVMTRIYNACQDPEAKLRQDELQAKEAEEPIDLCWRRQVVVIKSKRGKEYFFIPSQYPDQDQEELRDMVYEIEAEECGVGDLADDDDDGSLEAMDRATRQYEESRW